MEEREFWVVWSQISGIGPVLLQRIRQQFGSLAAAWRVDPRELGAVEGFGRQMVEKVAIARSQLDPQKVYREHLQKNPHFWTPADADYPRLLLEIPNPPPVLYYRGQVEPLENQGIVPAVAIVGTRYPSEYGKRWTWRITKALTQRGFAIVSGMAKGIDTEAHRACLESGGRTIAVFGTGIDVIYPRENANLYKKLQESGLLLTEYKSGTTPDKSHFPQRNRIVAALCRATIIIEAPARSGALITARIANEYGRDVYVLPGSLDNPNAIGCLTLINKGAQLILGEDHLLEMLGEMPPLDLLPTTTSQQLELFAEPKSAPSVELDPPLRQVFDALPPEDTPFDAIVAQAGMDAATVSSALLQLELLGVVVQLPGMRYRRSP
ncbi:DNA-processing protein DprA [Oxynema aestuarii]|uniref:DNA-protecting protein DprA n=1 Tax=Oxynema aestuarii AP17 TaxID=2064643 RepID=A0A6H1TRV3_9CYAN|nr:DNA-processing protein DprA [Oxynema aestuarii]QIZ69324.1 DNA-protecting protein DprA [Oxynema aestuarii AP17]